MSVISKRDNGYFLPFSPTLFQPISKQKRRIVKNDTNVVKS